MNDRCSSKAAAVAIFTSMALFAGLDAVGTEAPVRDFAAVRGDRAEVVESRRERTSTGPSRDTTSTPASS